MSKYLTTRDVATELRRSTRFVADELRRKNLRGHLVGGEWLIDPADLDTYIQSRANVRPVRRAS